MTTFRYVPESVMCVVSTHPVRDRMEPVVSRKFVPVSQRVPGDYCIDSTAGVLILTTLTGNTRVWGMDGAVITADLRMVVTRKEWTEDPESCSDEVIRKQWPIAEVTEGNAKETVTP